MYEIYENYFGYIFLLLNMMMIYFSTAECSIMLDRKKKNDDTFCSYLRYFFHISLYFDLKIRGSMLSFLISINLLACKQTLFLPCLSGCFSQALRILQALGWRLLL